MHFSTRVDDQWLRKLEKITSESDVQGAGMLQHDHDIGVVLQAIKDMGLDKNAIIVYSTDIHPYRAGSRSTCRTS